MRKRKVVSLFLGVLLLFSSSIDPVYANEKVASESDLSKIDLLGDWHFTNGDNVELYSQPKYNSSSWAKIQPATGFLSQETLPSESFAWFRKDFTVPKEFSKENLTLALGKIDDADEVFLNGKLVASTGFSNGEYSGSFWSQAREYELDASALHYGKKNTIAIRVYNAGGGGGIYEGPLGIFTESALRAEKGLPHAEANAKETKKVIEFLKNQQRFINTNKMHNYNMTLANDYFHNGYSKTDQIDYIKNLYQTYQSVKQQDERISVFKDNERYIVVTHRKIIVKNNNDSKVLVNEKQERYFVERYGLLFEIGNQSRFYKAFYYSDAFQQDMPYRVYLPEGYLNAKERYPTVYLLHQYGSSSQQYEVDNIQEKLDKWISEGIMQKMVVIMPDTSGNSWYVNKTDEPWMNLIVNDLVPHVDSTYRTIDNPDFRGISGVSMGGFGAYVIGLNYPNLFKSVSSHMGALSFEFEGQNPMKLIQSTDPEMLKSYSLYLDGGTEDALTSMPNSTNDIHIYLRENNIEHEFSTRAGSHNSEFYLASMHQSFAMHSKHFTKNLLTGRLDVTPQAITIDTKTATANYDVSVSNDILKYKGTNVGVSMPMNIQVQVTDPTNEVIHSQQTEIKKVENKKYEGQFDIPTQSLSDGDYRVHLVVNMLGKRFEIATKPIIIVSPPIISNEEARIDLLGDWKFKLDYDSPSDISNLVTEDCSIVQPGLGWWKNGFGGYDDIESYNGGAWYVRDFEVPADFPLNDLTLLGGKIDDADEIFVNGILIGSTGMEKGAFISSHWAELREYKLERDILKPGEKNTIAIHMYDNSGDGGIYSGPIGIYSKQALRKAKGLPYEKASGEVENQVQQFIENQMMMLQNKDFVKLSDTLSDNYFNDGKNKNDQIDDLKLQVSKYKSLDVQTTNVEIYKQGDNTLYVEADVVMKGYSAATTPEVLMNTSRTHVYALQEGGIREIGNQKRMFVDQYFSESIGETKTARIYLPKEYAESTKSYPVVYLLHQFQSDSSSFELDNIHNILDQAMEDEVIQDMIVVMPDSNGMSWWVNQSDGKAWMDMVTKDLVPYIDSNYRTIADKEHRGVSGVSMGGFGAYVIGLSNTDLFTSFASHMGALSSVREGLNPIELVKSFEPTNLQEYSFYFDSGDRDFYYFDIPALQLHSYLKSQNVPHVFQIKKGTHNSAFYTSTIVDSFKMHSEHFNK
ncbi:hypothetical protein EJF36_12600 [Bacillus sp. HMF5848]|uniref:alpha/beta hydrolase-fold protein n=1 Tax=Bacillus sp. HMF5848 TaxID=2495421 RepID=UPI000F77E858|nr:alpha/beta hydrolase-fold protein [Bacillus sp. HMF5848]RSK27649.1 hypothetical protein EJF36_12600 [Bacillus sp. HMF5848]